MSKILLKIKVAVAPDVTTYMGLKHTYREFDTIEEAFAWVFTNKNTIISYEAFTLEKYETITPRESKRFKA